MRDDSHVQDALPDCCVGEDDEILLEVVLHDLELTMAKMQLGAEGVADVKEIHIVVVAVEPTNSSLVDELVAISPDGARCRHCTERVSRPSARVAWVPRRRRDGFGATDNLRKGALVNPGGSCRWGAESVNGALMTMRLLGFMKGCTTIEITHSRSVPRMETLPTSVGGTAEASYVVCGKAIKTSSLHLLFKISEPVALSAGRLLC